MTELVDLVKHVATRLDAMSVDLARDVGAVVRDASAAGRDAHAFATQLRRATPRVARLAQAGAALFARHRWLRLRAAAATGAPALREDDHRELAHRVVAIAGELRGGIAKLGQIASCRPDLVGPIWATELARLQDDVTPVPVEAIRARIAGELGPVDGLFATFDPIPLAAASLAQVHAATLRDGTRVAVKVQVPGIEDIVAADIAALRTVASTLGELPGIDLPVVVAELSRALDTELDYTAEAAALAAFVTTAVTPRVVAAASSRRVLTMTLVHGEPLATALATRAAAERDRLLAALVAELAAQILARGHVHADPHPGNIFVTPDGQLAFLDFGCTLVLAPAERAAYARLLIAVAGGDLARAEAALTDLGFSAAEPAQLASLTQSIIGALRPGTSAATLDWQAAIADQLSRARHLHGLVIPRSFVLLGRVLATIGGLLAAHRPAIELYPLVAPHLAAAVR